MQNACQLRLCFQGTKIINSKIWEILKDVNRARNLRWIFWQGCFLKHTAFLLAKFYFSELWLLFFRIIHTRSSCVMIELKYSIMSLRWFYEFLSIYLTPVTYQSKTKISPFIRFCPFDYSVNKEHMRMKLFAPHTKCNVALIFWCISWFEHYCTILDVLQNNYGEPTSLRFSS